MKEQIVMEKYSLLIGHQMKDFYESLSEKGKRHYAAIEASELGHGGIIYISDLSDAIVIQRHKA